MTAKQFWVCTALSTFGSLIVVGAIALMARHAPKPADPIPPPAPVPVPLPPQPAPPPDVPVAIAVQKAKLKLSDGRTATFVFSATSGGLTCTAAIGLDEVLGYTLTPVSDPAAAVADAGTGADAAPSPNPPTPPPTRRRRAISACCSPTIPLTRTDVPPGQQAILTSPDLRSYLDKHCPLESGCASGRCPLTAGKSPSYRFLPANADVSRLAPVWQQTAAAVAGKPVPWMIAVNESGQTVIDQAWPASVEETLWLFFASSADRNELKLACRSRVAAQACCQFVRNYMPAPPTMSTWCPRLRHPTPHAASSYT